MSKLFANLGPALSISLLGAGLALAGCTTEAYCFSDCDGESTSSTGSSSASSGTGGTDVITTGTGGTDVITTGGCVPTNEGIEVCDGKDNDCNGKVDDVDFSLATSCGTCANDCTKVLANVDAASVTCTPSSDPGKVAGTCKGACAQDFFDVDGDGSCEYYCIKTANDDKTCDNRDDNCDGKKDEDLDLCSSVAACGACNRQCYVSHGTPKCVHSGSAACDTSNTQCEIDTCDAGFVDLDGSYATGCEYKCTPTNGGVEICDGLDNDCDGEIDKVGGAPTSDSVGACSVPPPVTGGVSACSAGTKACVNGSVKCQGATLPLSGATDTCGVDADCNGVLLNQPDLMTDPFNCGTCGNSCYADAVHSIWSCEAKACKFDGCMPGFYDLDGDNKCEYACTKTSDKEVCNGKDDNCDGVVDEPSNMLVPPKSQTCGISASATSPECSSGVTLACKSGGWKCTFPAGVCNGSSGCSNTPEICDALDNNCNGALNETTPNYGKSCASDDGKAYPGDGVCRTTGTYLCNGTGATKCSATKDSTKAGAELCDGQDNDCDGSVDEPFSAKGSNATYYVKPAVAQIGTTGKYIYRYEASRPLATSVTSGRGNGYFTSAPAGVTLDKTPACSEANKVPWFNVTPDEAGQVCKAAGGRLCLTSEWKNSCYTNTTSTTGDNCAWGYGSTSTGVCATAATTSKYCNLGVGPAASKGLLPTASADLKQCWAEWGTSDIFDITGNLREITANATTNPTSFPLMGGAFDTQTEAGATCDFDFYTVTDKNFQLYNTGFRCCFDSNPN